MKKLTLAALMAVTTTVSMAQVEISGKIGTYYESSEKAGVNTTSLQQEGTNNIAFKAKEDLGGGLSARVVVETKLFSNDPKSANTQLGDRQSTVGLANKMGSIDMGRNNHSAFNTLRFTDSFGALYGTIADDVHNFRANRFSNGVFLKATPYNGIGLSYDRVQASASGPEGLSYGATAELGALKLDVSRWELGQDTSNVLGVVATISGYRLNFLTSEDTTSNVTTKGTSVGMSKQLGSSPYTMMTSYGKKTGVASSELTAYNVGMDYAFSKRTSGQVIYRKTDAVTAALDSRMVAVGLIHKF
jgi:predicted porin